jgi:hypothetical protein
MGYAVKLHSEENFIKSLSNLFDNLEKRYQDNLTNFIIGKTYFLTYTRGGSTELKITSGGDVIWSYIASGTYWYAFFIFKATSTKVTVQGGANYCFFAKLD